MPDPYVPEIARVEKIIEETPTIKTFRLRFASEASNERFAYKPGQFLEVSAFGTGEAPFCIASSPTRKEYIECSIKKSGMVTCALHELEEGDMIGLRGPYGNGFDTGLFKNRNLLFVAGGIGLAPLRSLINYCADKRPDYGRIEILCGSRNVSELVYREELSRWKEMPDARITVTVDPGGETEGWDGKVGLVPSVLGSLAPSPENAYAMVCGPPVMIKFTLPVLLELGFPKERIITTLERKMQCGFGKCGHCMISGKYVCKDGPVFSLAEMMSLEEA